MANYLDSVLVNGQVIANQNVQKHELRAKKPTLMELALKNQSISNKIIVRKCN